MKDSPAGRTERRRLCLDLRDDVWDSVSTRNRYHSPSQYPSYIRASRPRYAFLDRERRYVALRLAFVHGRHFSYDPGAGPSSTVRRPDHLVFHIFFPKILHRISRGLSGPG